MIGSGGAGLTCKEHYLYTHTKAERGYYSLKATDFSKAFKFYNRIFALERTLMAVSD